MGEAEGQRTARRSAAGLACPGCGGADRLVFWRAKRMPVLCHAQCPTREAALAVPCAPIELALCRACGLVYNQVFDEELIAYSAAYENALHFSPHFRAYADALARHLVEQRGIRGGRVLEVGCGDGQFLQRVCELGGNQGLGLDPAYDPERSAVSDDSDVRIVAATFEARLLEAFPADLICCRHVLEHLDAPMTLLRTIRAAIGARRDVLLYFEVPNVLHTIERMGIWDIIYEHCLYFTPDSLKRIFQDAGFEAVDGGDAYGGQFAWIEARPATPRETESNGAPSSDLEQRAQDFQARSRARMTATRERLLANADAGRRAVVWGAGSKAVTMLNALGLDETIVAAAVDRNPRKHGHHVVGAGQRIIAPEELPALQPDAVVVMNPLYRDEIAQELDALHLHPELIVA
ncbi:MAG: class I SAM-dependent methyltransferase [Phycisphaeraceae bacterium]